MSVLDRYAYWLPRLSERDREYARAKLAEVELICATDAEAPEWGRMYYAWTVAALDAENPRQALREAIDAEAGDPREMWRAVEALDRTASEWAEWWPAWHPSVN